MNILKKLFGSSKDEASTRVVSQFKAVEECQAGLAHDVAAFIVRDYGNGVLSTLSTSKVKGVWAQSSTVWPRSAGFKNLFAPGCEWSEEQLARFGDVLAALEPLGAAKQWAIAGTHASPDWLRYVISVLAERERKICDMGRLARLAALRGLGVGVLLDILFSPDPAHYGRDHSTDHFDGVNAWLSAHAAEIAAAASALPAGQRVQLLTAIGRYAQVDAYLDLAVESGISSSKTVREAAQKLLPSADATRLQTRLDEEFARNAPAARAEIATLAARGLGTAAALLLERWRTEETNAKVLASLDMALASATLSAQGAETVDADRNGYVALDGSLVEIGPIPPAPPSSAVPDRLMELLLPSIRGYNESLEKAKAEAVKEHWHWSKGRAPIGKAELAAMKRAIEADTPPKENSRLFDWMRVGQGMDLPTLQAFFSAPEISLRHLVMFARNSWNNDLLALYGNWAKLEVVFELQRRIRAGADFRTIHALWTETGGNDAIIMHLESSWNSRIGDIDAELLWPLAAEYLERIEEGLGFRPQSGKSELHLDRALELLAILPRVPRRLLMPLMSIATGSRKAPRLEARRLLAGAPDINTTIAKLLTDGKQEVRAGAVEWLGQRGAVEEIPAIREVLKGEKSDLCRAAMISALERLGSDVSGYFDPAKMKAEAARGLEKTQAKGLEWFPMESLPALTWRDGTAVDKVLVRWWVVLANKLKQPAGNALIDLWLDRLMPGDADRLGRHVLGAWIGQDTRTATLNEANAYALSHIDARLQQHIQWAKRDPRYADYWITDRDKLFAVIRNEKLGVYLGSAADNKGLLALTTRMDGIDMAKTARSYLKNHGARVSQCKAVLDALASNPSSAAIQIVLATANRFKARTVQAHAAALIEDISSRRGWTADELADRTIPTAGLDESGEVELDCGRDRTFILKLDATDSLVLLNPAGKPVKALPSARVDEEKPLIEEAKKLLTTARKEIKQVMPDQVSRLREAMCLERQWPVEDWQLYVLGHPLVARLARRLVWMGLDESGTCVATFRPLDDNSLTDTDDRPVDISRFSRLQLGHSRLVPPEVAQSWSSHLTDYEVLSPIDQFGRPLPAIEPEQKNKEEITDRKGWMIDTFKLRGAALKLGYVRGTAEDGGVFVTYERRYTSAGLVALIHFSGSPLPEENKPAALLELTFAKLRRNSAYHGGAIKLGDVPPVLLAETWQDLREIAAKGTGFDPEWEKKTPW
jgi:hypothetical protein